MDTTQHFDGAQPLHGGRFFALGIALVVIGTIALGAPLLTTVASVVWYGAFVLAAGVIETATVFGARGWRGVLVHLLAGISGMVLGVLLLTHPTAGAAGLTLVVAALFLVGGIARAVAAIALRFPSWGWALGSGLLAALMGAWIAAGWPSTSLFTIGTLVAVEMIVRGWGWIMLATQIRRLAKTATAGAPTFVSSPT
jgi:uncharacterized membrane protein HdeD (DUF308 family)